MVSTTHTGDAGDTGSGKVIRPVPSSLGVAGRCLLMTATITEGVTKVERHGLSFTIDAYMDHEGDEPSLVVEVWHDGQEVECYDSAAADLWYAGDVTGYVEFVMQFTARKKGLGVSPGP